MMLKNLITIEQYKEAQELIRLFELQQARLNESRQMYQDVLDMKMSDYKFSVRLRNCLKMYCSKDLNMPTWADAKMQDIELIQFRRFRQVLNCGKKTINELLEIAEQLGFVVKRQ
ncbi:MAG: hypothetical protein ABJH04_07650 [Cyclobacteriaceae bacterium]